MKAFKGTGNPQKLYLSILLSFIICAAATLVISATILYFNLERLILAQVYSDNVLNLKLTSRTVAINAETALKLAYQIYTDFNISKLQYYSTPDIYDLRSAFAQLSNYRRSASFIEAIYVYNGKNDTFYIDSDSYNYHQRESIQTVREFDDGEIVRLINDYRKYHPYIPIPRRAAFKNQRNSIGNYYSFFLYDVFSKGKLNSAVIVNVSEEWIHRVLEDIRDQSQDGDTFIINSKGVLVSNLRNSPMLTDLSRETYIRTILRNRQSAGYFTANVNGIRTLVSFTGPDSFGWRYIRKTPLLTILGKIKKARIQTVFISLLILVGGLLAAYLISRRIYLPIDRIFKELRDLEIAKRKSDHLEKQEYLRSILLEPGKPLTEAQSLKFEPIHTNLRREGSFAIVLLKIDDYHDFLLRYVPEDKNHCRERIGSVSEEIFQRFFGVEPVDLGNDSLVLILNAPFTPDELSASVLMELVKQLQIIVWESLQISLSAIVSPIETSLSDLASLYNQVTEAALHRLFYGHGCIIASEKISEFKRKEYHYPTGKEKVLVDALMVGDVDEVKAVYSEIISETAEYTFDAFNLALSRLIFTMNDTMNTIRNNNHLSEGQNVNVKPLSVILSEMETLAEIDAYLFKLLESLSDSLAQKRNSKHEQLVRRINEIIGREYVNPDLSIDHIADRLDITASYLCRLYKQLTLTTILDRIVAVRMNQAKELLLQTKLTVGEIAQKVGFANSSYFYKTFKKMNGVTPNDFRIIGRRHEAEGGSGL